MAMMLKTLATFQILGLITKLYQITTNLRPLQNPAQINKTLSITAQPAQIQVHRFVKRETIRTEDAKAMSTIGKRSLMTRTTPIPIGQILSTPPLPLGAFTLSSTVSYCKPFYGIYYITQTYHRSNMR